MVWWYEGMTLYVVYINIYIHSTIVRGYDAICCIYPWYDGTRVRTVCCIYRHISMVWWYEGTTLYVVYIDIYIHSTMVWGYALYVVYIDIYIHGTRVRRYMLYILYISTYIARVRKVQVQDNNSINITMPAEKLLSIRNLYFWNSRTFKDFQGPWEFRHCFLLELEAIKTVEQNTNVKDWDGDKSTTSRATPGVGQNKGRKIETLFSNSIYTIQYSSISPSATRRFRFRS